MITDAEIPMMPMFSEEARNLFRDLLERDPLKRLGSGPRGVEDIKDHVFFYDIGWDLVATKQTKPTFVPAVES